MDIFRKLLRRINDGCECINNIKDKSESDTEEIENDSDTTLEISISVPNLSDIIAGATAPSMNRPVVQRSISDSQVFQIKMLCKVLY